MVLITLTASGTAFRDIIWNAVRSTVCVCGISYNSWFYFGNLDLGVSAAVRFHDTTANMRGARSSILRVLPLYANFARGDRYASNQNPTVVDSPQVAANFPDLDDVKLLSPAFVDSASVPSTFANGTSGPTPQSKLGTFFHL